jgi:shikimate kinase
MPLSHIVYMIGFMGSGKSTAGKKLASGLGWSFIDLDKKIEETTGKSIPVIFAENGEAYFRNAESELLKSLQSHGDTVISSGGGTPCHSNNMDFMLASGVTVYLKLNPAQLKSRLAGSQDSRPLLRGLNDEAMLEFIKEKLAIREEWYNRAEIIIDGFDPDIKYLQNLIKKRLKI